MYSSASLFQVPLASYLFEKPRHTAMLYIYDIHILYIIGGVGPGISWYTHWAWVVVGVFDILFKVTISRKSYISC